MVNFLGFVYVYHGHQNINVQLGVSALSLSRLIKYLYKKAQVIRLEKKTETKVQAFDTESTSKKLT